jgi:hypothetical protein
MIMNQIKSDNNFFEDYLSPNKQFHYNDLVNINILDHINNNNDTYNLNLTKEEIILNYMHSIPKSQLSSLPPQFVNKFLPDVSGISSSHTKTNTNDSCGYSTTSEVSVISGTNLTNDNKHNSNCTHENNIINLINNLTLPQRVVQRVVAPTNKNRMYTQLDTLIRLISLSKSYATLKQKCLNGDEILCNYDQSDDANENYDITKQYNINTLINIPIVEFLNSVFETYANDNSIIRQFAVDFSRQNVVINNQNIVREDDFILEIAKYNREINLLNKMTLINDKNRDKISLILLCMLFVCQSSYYMSYMHIHNKVEKTKIVSDDLAKKRKLRLLQKKQAQLIAQELQLSQEQNKQNDNHIGQVLSYIKQSNISKNIPKNISKTIYNLENNLEHIMKYNFYNSHSHSQHNDNNDNNNKKKYLLENSEEVINLSLSDYKEKNTVKFTISDDDVQCAFIAKYQIIDTSDETMLYEINTETLFDINLDKIMIFYDSVKKY